MKRIIDGMSAKQIAGGCGAIVNRVELEEYLESLCKPVPIWEDDVSDYNHILCWVSDSPIPEAACTNLSEYVDHVTEINEKGYIATSGFRWKYARPISPDEIWQPTKQGDAK